MNTLKVALASLVLLVLALAAATLALYARVARLGRERAESERFARVEAGQRPGAGRLTSASIPDVRSVRPPQGPGLP
jgi:hypothetical protein